MTHSKGVRAAATGIGKLFDGDLSGGRSIAEVIESHTHAGEMEDRNRALVKELVDELFCSVCNARKFTHLGDKVLQHRADCPLLPTIALLARMDKEGR